MSRAAVGLLPCIYRGWQYLGSVVKDEILRIPLAAEERIDQGDIV